MKKISTNQAPAAIGPYSQAIVHNGIIYISGQIPVDPSTSCVVEGGIVEQTQQVIKNIAAILKEGGADFDSVIKTSCFIKNMGDFAEFNGVYAKAFTSCPARACVEVAKLPKDVLVEIEVIAAVKE